MSGNDILHASSISPQVLVSQQLGTTEGSVYTVAASQSVKVAHGTLCNVTATAPAPTLALSVSTNSAVTSPTITLGTTSASGGTFTAGTYYWKVTLTTIFGETAGSNEVTATLAANGTQVINWTANSAGTGYKVYRGTTAGGENVLVTTISGSSTATYTDTGAAGTTGVTVPTAPTSSAQFWKVSTITAAGETLPSNEVTATMAANQQATLSWNTVSGATGYKMYRGTTAGGENVILNGNLSGTSYVDQGNYAGYAGSPVTSQATGAAAVVYLSIVKSGGTVGDGTHRAISSYSLAANDTLSLRDYLAGAMLGPGDAIAAYASAAGAVDLVITGTVHA